MWSGHAQTRTKHRGDTNAHSSGDRADGGRFAEWIRLGGVRWAVWEAVGGTSAVDLPRGTAFFYYSPFMSAHQGH